MCLFQRSDLEKGLKEADLIFEHTTRLGNGFGLFSIREDEDAAESLGIDTAIYKWLAFGISAFFPGLIQEINHQRITILLVEQNVQTTLRIAHHAYVLETGKIIMEGSGSVLLTDGYVQKAYLGV